MCDLYAAVDEKCCVERLMLEPSGSCVAADEEARLHCQCTSQVTGLMCEVRMQRRQTCELSIMGMTYLRQTLKSCSVVMN